MLSSMDAVQAQSRHAAAREQLRINMSAPSEIGRSLHRADHHFYKANAAAHARPASHVRDSVVERVESTLGAGSCSAR